MKSSPGIVVVDRREDGGYDRQQKSLAMMQSMSARIRQDATIPHGINMWVVSDNLRKGAALNAVQIAETLIAQFALRPQLAA